VFVGHPLDADGLFSFVLSTFPRHELAAWRQRLEEKQPEDFCVAIRAADGWQASLLAQDLGGNASLIWPPASVDDAPQSSGHGPNDKFDWHCLGERLFSELRRRGVRYTQALLAPEKSDAIDRLLQLGMNQLTTMDYMVAHVGNPHVGNPSEGVDEQPVAKPSSDELTMQLIGEWDSLSNARICQVVNGTYDKTLDCPELDGIRTVEEVVRGYQSSAPLQLWIAQSAEKQDAGILILSDHPEHRQSELTYMGLLPTYRGRGWGGQLVRFAMEQTKTNGREKIVLAVDRRNTPAIEQYRRSGFHGWTSRVCLTRNLA
jgi:ribosomal protein S18 acetylase RimI-like enzyme